MNERFTRLANFVSGCAGSASAFVVAVLITAAWAISGPMFHYSDAWQLTINTGTGIVTFLMVFLIQNAQSRDTKTIHQKLNELLRSQEEAERAAAERERRDAERLRALTAEIERLLQNDPLRETQTSSFGTGARWN